MLAMFQALRQVLVEPVDTLLGRLIHGLLVLVILVVTPKRKAVHLILVDPDLALQAVLGALLIHELLDLTDLLFTQQTVLVAERKSTRDNQVLKVRRNGDERRVAGVYGIGAAALAVRKGLLARENGVAAAPAEANDAHFVGAGDEAHLVDKVLDDGPGHGLAVLDEPGAQGRARLGRRGRRLDGAARLADGQLRLNRLQEAVVERVALVDVGDVGGEARVGVGVGQQTRVCKVPAKDCRVRQRVQLLYSDVGILAVDEENDRLGRLLVLGRGYVGLDARNGLDAPLGLAFVHFARQAARGHSDTGGHVGGVAEKFWTASVGIRLALGFDDLN